MQLTILSVKLPDQTDAEFDHEFRTVHVQATREIAESLGLINCYVQGVRLTTSFNSKLSLSDPSNPLKAFAQLTWPSPNVLQGALHTTSAGANKDVGVLLTAFVLPKEGMSEEEFTKKWDSHASKFRSDPAIYQRNKAMDLTRRQVEEILGNTLFPPEMTWLNGGYDEFVFKSEDEARGFLEKQREALNESYGKFVNVEKSMFVGWDRIVQYSEEERGIAQVIKGGIIGSVLGTKTALGF